MGNNSVPGGMTWGIALFQGNDMGNNSVPGGMAWGIPLFLGE